MSRQLGSIIYEQRTATAVLKNEYCIIMELLIFLIC